MVVMYASLQPVGTMPVDSSDWKIMVRAGASSSTSSLNTRGLMPSGPPALYGLRSSISFFTPCSDILISSIAGMPLSAIPVFNSNSSAVYCLPVPSPKTETVRLTVPPVPWGQRLGDHPTCGGYACV